MEQDYKEKSRLWKVLDRTYLYRDAWLTARKDRVQLPNGNIIPNYYILEYPNWVNTIAITKDVNYGKRPVTEMAIGRRLWLCLPIPVR